MADNSEARILKEKKEAYVKKIKEKGKMTLDDAYKLKRFDCSIFMAKHPLIKKFDKWLHPEIPAGSDKKTILKNIFKEAAKLAVTFPIAIPHNLFLDTMASYWVKKNINKYASEENKKEILKERIMRKIAYTVGMPGIVSMKAEGEVNDLSSHRTPLNSEREKELRGIGPKPVTPVHKSTVDRSVVSDRYERK